MQDRESFLETLDELVNLAETNNRTITMDEIKKAFKDADLGEDKFEPIYAYLAENKITIKNYIPMQEKNTDVEEESKEESAESAYLQMYLDDLDAIPECDASELGNLYEKIKLGEEAAKTRMIEGSLKFVVSISKEYRGKGMIIGDLIQEGNMGLMNAVATLVENDWSNVKEYLEKEIRGSIENAIMEQNSEANVTQEALIKVNRLSKAAKELEDELGRIPDVLEMAKYMNVTKEEIEDIIRLSKDVLKADHHH